jgi:hypothetical protein
MAFCAFYWFTGSSPGLVLVRCATVPAAHATCHRRFWLVLPPYFLVHHSFWFYRSPYRHRHYRFSSSVLAGFYGSCCTGLHYAYRIQNKTGWVLPPTPPLRRSSVRRHCCGSAKTLHTWFCALRYWFYGSPFVLVPGFVTIRVPLPAGSTVLRSWTTDYLVLLRCRYVRCSYTSAPLDYRWITFTFA